MLIFSDLSFLNAQLKELLRIKNVFVKELLSRYEIQGINTVFLYQKIIGAIRTVVH